MIRSVLGHAAHVMLRQLMRALGKATDEQVSNRTKDERRKLYIH
jgi:hypothetical protein